MKQKILLLACCLSSIMLRSQSEQKVFSDWKTNEGTQNFFHKNVTKTDGDGNVYVAGATTNTNGTTDILLAKYNNEGTQQWVEQYNGSANFHDFAAGLYLDANGGVYITGTVCNDDVNFTTDLIVMKYDDQGVQQWTYTYDGGSALHDGGKDIIVDGSGYVFVTGASYNSSLNTDVVTISLDDTGSEQWVRTYDYVSGLDDIGYRMEFKGSEILIVGAATNSFNDYRVLTLDYDASGSLLADDVSSATSTSSVEIVSDMVTDASGNVYICGAAQISGQGYNYFTVKLDNLLAVVWQQTYNGANSLDDLAKGIKVDASGNVYVTGYSTSSTQGRDIVTIKYNSSGTQQWLQTCNSATNGDDEGTDMEIDNSSNLYITGSMSSDINSIDYYTVKYNSSGTKIWDIQTDGHHLNDRATNLALDISGNVIVTGQSETAPNVFEYITEKYLQKDIITPTDFNGEIPNNNYRYYANQGQLITTTNTAVPEIKYYTHNTYPAFYYKDNSLSMVFSRIDTLIATDDTLHRIDLSFTNSYENAKTYPLEQKRDGYLNYFLAHTPDGVSGVFGNERLVTTNLYNNIDLMYSSNQNGIKYYFIVKPGGDPRDIKLDFTGASSFSLNGTTNALSINSSIGSITFETPTVYQLTSANATVAVTGWTADWQTDGASNKYNFNTGSYTSSLTLVIQVDQGNTTTSASAIDNLTWSTFYGGSSDDVFYDVKTNSSNNVWVTGRTTSTNFPVVNSYQGTNAGNVDAIFVKFSNTGIRLWSTYIGGSLDEASSNQHGIEVDASGNSYSAFRTTSINFPTNNSGISGAYYDNVNSTTPSHTPEDVAIVSFNNNGVLTWSTYFGGNGWIANSYDIGLDNNNNLFVTGIDNGFPLVNPSGSYQNTFPIASGGAYFIAKFNPNHNLIWSTFFGSNGPLIEKLAFNSNNDILMVGRVNNGTGAYFDAVDPGSGAYFNNSYNSTIDGFIAKFSGTTNALVWSTLYGGNDDDKIHAIVTDNSNNIYISGETSSTSSLISGNSFGMNNTSFGGSGSYFSLPIGDGFLAKFNSTNQFVSSTYFGGAANEGSFDIAYKNNRLFIPFVTAGDDVPFHGSNPSGVFVQANNSSGQDVSNDGYFAVMDANFNFEWSTYFGGTSSGSASTKDDQIFSNICSNDSKYYIVGGAKSSSGFPLVNPASGAYYQGTKSSSLDAFIAQFNVPSTLAVSVKEIDNDLNENLFIYPNPANNSLNIQFKSNSKYSVELIDIYGRVVRKLENQTSNLIKLDVSNLSQGTYIVKIINNDRIGTKKLIIN